MRAIYKVYYYSGLLIFMACTIASLFGRQFFLNLVGVSTYLSFPIFVTMTIALCCATILSLFPHFRERSLLILSIASFIYLVFFALNVAPPIESFPVEFLPVADWVFVVVSYAYAIQLIFISKRELRKLQQVS